MTPQSGAGSARRQAASNPDLVSRSTGRNILCRHWHDYLTIWFHGS